MVQTGTLEEKNRWGGEEKGGVVSKAAVEMRLSVCV